VDSARTAFSLPLLAVIAGVVLVAIVFILLPIFAGIMADLSAGFRVGIPAGFIAVAIAVSLVTTSTTAHFDRSARLVKHSTKRLVGGCCAASRELPFRVFSGVRPSSSHGARVDLYLIIDGAKLRDLEEADAADESILPDAKCAPPTPSAAAKENADDEEALLIANVENAPDVLRSWERYVTWLRDDAF
jgi:hypothetical protein